MKVILTFKDEEDRNRVVEYLDSYLEYLHDEHNSIEYMESAMITDLGYQGEGYYDYCTETRKYKLVCTVDYTD